VLEGEAWMAQMWVWNGVNLPPPVIILIIICQDRLGTNTNEKNNSVKNIAGAFVPQAAAMARPALAAMRSVQVA
jgi:hypothetical protein